MDFLYIYEGGSDNGKMIKNMTGNMNDIKEDVSISIHPSFQAFVVFHTSGSNAGKGFHAKILQSKFILIVYIISLHTIYDCLSNHDILLILLWNCEDMCCHD